MKIRTAQRDDLERIVAIYNQAIRKRQTGDICEIGISDRENWFAEHDEVKFPIFVGEIDSEIVAWLSISRYRPGRDAFLNVGEISYYVKEKKLGIGLGKSIVNYALDFLEQTEMKAMVAIILGSNTKSIDFIQKFGFEEWGRFPGIAEIDGERYDHVYMGLRIKSL